MKTKINNAIGWLGANLLAFCALPAAIDVYNKQDASGYDSVFLAMWGFGEIFTLYYILNQKKLHYPLIFNYLINILLISYIIYYKL